MASADPLALLADGAITIVEDISIKRRKLLFRSLLRQLILAPLCLGFCLANVPGMDDVRLPQLLAALIDMHSVLGHSRSRAFR